MTDAPQVLTDPNAATLNASQILSAEGPPRGASHHRQGHGPLTTQPPHMSDELYAVWKNIKPGPHYAPYEISALKAEVVRLRSENAKLRLPSQAGEGGVAEELHPATTDLVDRFAAELKSKLAKAEAKYGYAADWLNPDWQSELIESLAEHIHKGDPRDVAAYCAFAWHHGWPVSGAVDCFSRSFSPHAENDQSTTTPPSDPRLDRAIEALEKAVWSLSSFGQLAADEEDGNTEGLDDEVIVRMTFPDPEFGGEKTLLGELFIRAFRKAKAATDECRQALASIRGEA